jgi:pilus assembly protein Flp/PilA
MNWVETSVEKIRGGDRFALPHCVVVFVYRKRVKIMIRQSNHKSLRKADQKRSGQALVEYIVIVAAVALVALMSVSMFGHKVADQYAVGAGMLPGAHAEDNLPITTGEYAGFTENAGGTALISNGQVSWADVTGNTETGVLRNNVVVSGGNTADAFVAE